MKRLFSWLSWTGLIMVIVVSVLALTQLLLPMGAVAKGEGSPGIENLIPDIGKIYREAIYTQLERVEGEITDPDIHNFYLEYLENAGLRR